MKSVGISRFTSEQNVLYDSYYPWQQSNHMMDFSGSNLVKKRKKGIVPSILSDQPSLPISLHSEINPYLESLHSMSIYFFQVTLHNTYVKENGGHLQQFGTSRSNQTACHSGSGSEDLCFRWFRKKVRSSG